MYRKYKVTEPKGSNFSAYRKSLVSEMFDIGDSKPLNSGFSKLDVDCGSAIKTLVIKNSMWKTVITIPHTNKKTEGYICCLYLRSSFGWQRNQNFSQTPLFFSQEIKTTN